MPTIDKRPNGKFRARVRVNGHVETATFDRLTDAREWANDQEVLIRRGKHFKKAEAEKHNA